MYHGIEMVIAKSSYENFMRIKKMKVPYQGNCKNVTSPVQFWKEALPMNTIPLLKSTVWSERMLKTLAQYGKVG